MEQIRELVFYKHHFHAFFDAQTSKIRDKIELVVLFNGFQKKIKKTPKQEIAAALKLMKAYFNEKTKDYEKGEK